MAIFGIYIGLFFGIPAAVILSALICYYREHAQKYRNAQQSQTADPAEIGKLKRRKMLLLVSSIIGAVFVAALVTVAVLVSTSISFM